MLDSEEKAKNVKEKEKAKAKKVKEKEKAKKVKEKEKEKAKKVKEKAKEKAKKVKEKEKAKKVKEKEKAKKNINMVGGNTDEDTMEQNELVAHMDAKFEEVYKASYLYKDSQDYPDYPFTDGKIVANQDIRTFYIYNIFAKSYIISNNSYFLKSYHNITPAFQKKLANADLPVAPRHYLLSTPEYILTISDTSLTLHSNAKVRGLDDAVLFSVKEENKNNIITGFFDTIKALDENAYYHLAISVKIKENIPTPRSISNFLRNRNNIERVTYTHMLHAIHVVEEVEEVEIPNS